MKQILIRINRMRAKEVGNLQTALATRAAPTMTGLALTQLLAMDGSKIGSKVGNHAVGNHTAGTPSPKIARLP